MSSGHVEKTSGDSAGNGALGRDEVRNYLGTLEFGWSIPNGHHLEKEYRFKDFREALGFVNRLGEAAEEQGHHPDIHLTWGRVRVTLWTHSVGGLTEKDFVLAAQADRLR
jgi:4a-hydroxytetrahydrobiopterin dehydratase